MIDIRVNCCGAYGLKTIRRVANVILFECNGHCGTV